MIDICMTSVVRPGIVFQTLTSFCEKLFTERDNYRLIINVDPIGETLKAKTVVGVCKKFFREVVYNYSNTPSFPNAVKWVWSQATSDFIFHLEDDWILTRKLDINDMIKILNEDKSIACLRLPKFKIPNSDKLKAFGVRYTYTGNNYFVTKSNNQFGLNPSLIKKAFVSEAVTLLTNNINPEKRFRPCKDPKVNNLINRWKFAIYGKPGISSTVVDIGPTWKDAHRFRKPTNSFLAWEKY